MIAFRLTLVLAIAVMLCSVGIAIAASQDCNYNGNLYLNGMLFKEDCNACVCTDGHVECTEMACAGCEYNGQQYKPGDSFKDAEGCNNCQCTETGVVACNLMAC